MKKLLYFAVLMAVVVACQEKKQQAQRTSQSTIDSITSTTIISQGIDRAIVVIDSFENTGDMYLGYAQGKLDKDEDAQKSYEAAYENLNELRKLDITWGQEYNCTSCLHNITLFNEEQKNYEKMAYWLARNDSIVQHFCKRDDVPDAYKNKAKAGLNSIVTAPSQTTISR